jgi:hypothetical protein
MISFQNGFVCAAQLNDGTTYYFSALSASVPTNAFDISAWNCPTKQCTVELDIFLGLITVSTVLTALVVDVSGSVANYWSTEKAFAINITQAFEISENATKFGYITFDTKAVVRSKVSLKLTT